MAQDRETEGTTTESTEQIPPGSMPPDDSGETAGDGANDPKVSDLPENPTDDEKADKESKDSFPASDPPAW